MNINLQATEINSLSDSVRQHINTHRYQSVLLDNSKTWNQICSSLDVIGDSLYAIESYETEEYPQNVGIKYIYTYGILQALILMQDALQNLSEAFGISFELTDTLKNIRYFRNASIGHPTKQDRIKGNKGKPYYNYISRITMSKSGFDLLRSSGDGAHNFVHVNIKQACLDQLDGIIKAYRNITEKLEEIDKMHKEKFKSAPLNDVFHSAMEYYFEKISQGIHSHSYGDREFGHRHIGLVKETYEKFKSALLERNELSEYTSFDLNEYFHALNRLDAYFSGSDTIIEEADARIYLSYLRHKHGHFFAIAKEIDDEYQTQT